MGTALPSLHKERSAVRIEFSEEAQADGGMTSVLELLQDCTFDVVLHTKQVITGSLYEVEDEYVPELGKMARFITIEPEFEGELVRIPYMDIEYMRYC